MEFCIEKCAMLVMKSGKRRLTDRMKLEKIRTLGEKKIYKYLEILEADTIKHVEMKKKLKKNVSGETEIYSSPNDIAETLSKI